MEKKGIDKEQVLKLFKCLERCKKIAGNKYPYSSCQDIHQFLRICSREVLPIESYHQVNNHIEELAITKKLEVVSTPSDLELNCGCFYKVSKKKKEDLLWTKLKLKLLEIEYTSKIKKLIDESISFIQQSEINDSNNNSTLFETPTPINNVPAQKKKIVEINSESTPGKKYTLDLTAKTCSCPSYQYRGVSCKHLKNNLYDEEEDLDEEKISECNNNFNTIEVPSENISGKLYTINIENQTCTCPDYQYRKNICKHLRKNTHKNI